MKIHTSDYDATQKGVVVNLRNHAPVWKTACFVDGLSAGVLEHYDGFDPDACQNLPDPDLPKPHSFAEPKRTRFLFKAMVPALAMEIKIAATDRFENQYEIIA